MSAKPERAGETVVVIGGGSGLGLETARRARAEGADVILAAHDPDRLHRVCLELGASLAAFDATDFERLGRVFDGRPTPIDHARVTGPGPYDAPLAEFNVEAACRTSTPICCCRCRSPGTPRQGAPGRDPALDGRHRWPPHGGGTRVQRN